MPTIKDQLDNNETTSNPQSTERAEVASKTYSLFSETRDKRDESKPLFRDRTFKNYNDDNIKRFIQFKQRPAHKKPWQSNLASSTPNEKLIGVLSKIATQGMESKVISTQSFSLTTMIKEKIINALLKKAAHKNNDDFQIILEMLSAAEKGTVIGMEDWFFGNQNIREVKDQDPETRELIFESKEIKKWNDVRSSLISLEDFYPGRLDVRPGMMQDMDFCFLRTKMTEDEFKMEFGKYTDADLVIPVSSLINESSPFWRQSEDVSNNQIEIIRYFNKKTDEFIILANEIWINPHGKSTVQPLPWNHKQLPFWASVFEPLDANFFYGRSMIDKMISYTDSKDALFDRILDQMTISVSKPVITDGSASSAFTKGFMQPNNVITTDWTNGRPNFSVIPIPEPPAMAVTIMQMLQENLDRATVSPEVIGGETSKRKTATEISVQQEGALSIISLFLKMMENGILHKNRLRLANMMQFYTLPSNKNEKGERFKKFVLRDQKLSNNSIGVLQISITNTPKQERVEEKDSSIPVPTEFIEITPRSIREFEGEIQIVPQSSIKMTEAQRQIVEINYQKVMNEFYPELFNKSYGFDQLNIVYGKNPSEARQQQPQPQAQPQPQGSMEGSPEPFSNLNNSVDAIL